ncbi:MAG: carboxymuconolactone decarboxylase family protein [Deltaproteobacteria bacterium]|nr:carboxymuconolactone decarboxylase family protein [Deltaproteobacteria bacterium]MBM4316525.1 carboxymuconolactone decarboxylase family protein [Deltaproteobacteria bacterium]
MQPRIPALPLAKYPWYLRLFFKLQLKKFGQILTPSLLWGYTPLPSLVFSLFYLVINRKKALISPELRSLAMVRVAQIHGCHFCIDLNSLFLLQRLTIEEKFLALPKWRESSQFSEKERAVLEYAEAMTQTECQVSDPMMEKLKSFISAEEIIELTGLIAYQNMSARFNSALNIPSQGLCQMKHPVKK